MSVRNDHTCYSCRWVAIGGIYFPLGCAWFPKHDKGETKDVPPDKIMTGCKFYEPEPEPVQQNITGLIP